MKPSWRSSRVASMAPVVMSSVALLIVLVHAARSDGAHEIDEGAAAHIWQLLMAAQVPIVLWYLASSLSRPYRTWVPTLLLQCGMAFLSCAAVFYLT